MNNDLESLQRRCEVPPVYHFCKARKNPHGLDHMRIQSVKSETQIEAKNKVERFCIGMQVSVLHSDQGSSVADLSTEIRLGVTPVMEVMRDTFGAPRLLPSHTYLHYL